MMAFTQTDTEKLSGAREELPATLPAELRSIVEKDRRSRRSSRSGAAAAAGRERISTIEVHSARRPRLRWRRSEASEA
jgi:hypothetical protein